MSDDGLRPAEVDPFAEGDPEAYERERRRAEREAKRRARDDRRSLGEMVSGVLDGATAKGRDVVEQGRERVSARKEPPREGAEPPPLRRTSRSGATSADRDGASRAPAAREPRSQPEPQPRPVASPPSDSAYAAADAELPPWEPSPAASGSSGYWRRRLLALVGLLIVAGAAAALLSRLGDGDPAPVPKGPRTLKTTSVTIPEGLGREEMAAVAEDAGLKGDYEKETAEAPKGFDIEKLGAPGDASLEGFLFPATYELVKGAKVEDLVRDQLTAFNENIDSVDLKAAEKKNLTTYDVVTIASMIEREVQVPKERPLVAAVIYNRLADDEVLGIDATLRYEVGFDEPLTESELEADSPYNTRINPGLPPTPIGNPGLDSLKAAADPADVDYKYYVFKPGSCNEHTFTDDYDEFLAASEEYQAALESEGGQPTDC